MLKYKELNDPLVENFTFYRCEVSILRVCVTLYIYIYIYIYTVLHITLTMMIIVSTTTKETAPSFSFTTFLCFWSLTYFRGRKRSKTSGCKMVTTYTLELSDHKNHMVKASFFSKEWPLIRGTKWLLRKRSKNYRKWSFYSINALVAHAI